ncbi:hypothetical protein TNCV_2034961 [Trichonephila clavipes]|nr:hypothetical protein TNCV_2034961 [Trichonephila clavipes]
MEEAQGLNDGSITSLSFMSLRNFWTSSCLANGSHRGCCLIGGCSPISIRCFVSLVFPKSSDVLENRLWNSSINPPAAHLCFSSKSVFCSKSLTRSPEERSWVLHFRSTQVTGAQAAITSPSCIALVLSLMLAILTGMTEFEKSTTNEAISTPAFKLSGSG